MPLLQCISQSRGVPGGPRLGSLELPHQEFTASAKHIPDLAQRATPLQGPTTILAGRDGKQKLRVSLADWLLNLLLPFTLYIPPLPEKPTDGGRSPVTGVPRGGGGGFTELEWGQQVHMPFRTGSEPLTATSRRGRRDQGATVRLTPDHSTATEASSPPSNFTLLPGPSWELLPLSLSPSSSATLVWLIGSVP